MTRAPFPARWIGLPLAALLGVVVIALAEPPAATKPADGKAQAKQKADQAKQKADQAKQKAAQAKQKADQERARLEEQHKQIADAVAPAVVLEADRAAAENAQAKADSTLALAALAAAAARAQADRAAKEAAAAKAAAEAAPPNRRPDAEKLARSRVAAAKGASERAAAAEATVARLTAEKKAAAQTIAEKGEALKGALAKAATVKAAAYGGLEPLPEGAWDVAKARHLLYRAGFGGTPAEVAQLYAMGLHRAVSHLVNYHRITAPPIPFEARPRERPQPFERKLGAAERNKLEQQRQMVENRQIQGMRAWWLRRMVESPRPLEEKLTLFWHGHFASEYETVFNSWYMLQQNQMFRQNAAGNFGALLRGLVHDPAMLRYLNNDTNVKGHPNENLAREIMELFALGLDQGYTEFDIREASRALTGYGYDYWTGQFRFAQPRHDTGPKKIFGRTGEFTGDDLVDLLLQQPATSRFIARKLFTYFACEEPAVETVERLAAVLRANNFELAPMLENLFTSAEFYGPRAVGTQIKSPVQLVVAAHRELGIKDGNYGYLAQSIRTMGQDLFQPPSVKGWDGGATWINANRVFLRYNALSEILESVPRAGGQRGLDVVGTILACKGLKDKAEVIDCLARTCLAVPLAADKRQALIDFLAPLPPPSEWQGKRLPEVNARLTALLALLTSSPEYQLT